MEPLRFGTFIMRRRKELGMDSQAELARRAGTTQTQINRIERELTSPQRIRHDVLKGLAQALELRLGPLALAAMEGPVNLAAVCPGAADTSSADWRRTSGPLLRTLARAESEETYLLRALLDIQDALDFPLSETSFAAIIQDFVASQPVVDLCA